MHDMIADRRGSSGGDRVCPYLCVMMSCVDCESRLGGSKLDSTVGESIHL